MCILLGWIAMGYIGYRAFLTYESGLHEQEFDDNRTLSLYPAILCYLFIILLFVCALAFRNETTQLLKPFYGTIDTFFKGFQNRSGDINARGITMIIGCAVAIVFTYIYYWKFRVKRWAEKHNFRLVKMNFCIPFITPSGAGLLDHMNKYTRWFVLTLRDSKGNMRRAKVCFGDPAGYRLHSVDVHWLDDI